MDESREDIIDDVISPELRSEAVILFSFKYLKGILLIIYSPNN